MNDKANTSLFATFGPIATGVTLNYVTTAMLEEAGFGADAAAPVVRYVFETISGQTGGAVVPVTSGGAN